MKRGGAGKSGWHRGVGVGREGARKYRREREIKRRDASRRSKLGMLNWAGIGTLLAGATAFVPSSFSTSPFFRISLSLFRTFPKYLCIDICGIRTAISKCGFYFVVLIVLTNFDNNADNNATRVKKSRQFYR